MRNLNTIYLFLIPLLVAGISLGYTTFTLCLVLLFLRLIFANRQSVAFFLVMYGGIIGGMIRAVYPGIPVYGIFLSAIGIFLVRDVFFDFIKKGKESLIYLVICFFVFALYYLWGPQDSFASDKLLNIIENGAFTVFGYYLFCSSSKIDNEGIFQTLLVSTILMFGFVIEYYNFYPGALFDYEWFRSQEYAWMATNHFENSILVSYQHIGMNVLFGLSIFLSKNKINKKAFVLYIIVSAQLILSSGCRQAIMGLFLIVILKLIIFKESSFKRSTAQNIVFAIGLGGILIMISYQLLMSLNIDYINNTIERGDSGRAILLAQGLQIFYENPFVGSGLGGFHAITGEVYPHNFIIEILCECGIVGAFIFSVLVFSCFKRAKLSIFYSTINNSYLFLVIAALSVRVLVSGDFKISIELFSAVFATLAVVYQRKQTNAVTCFYKKQESGKIH